MNAESLAARIGMQLHGPETPASAAVPLKPQIPDHELIARIGGGGYGEVWLARSVTGALRAVKVIRRASFSSLRPYEREFRGIVQFEPVSRTHPGLICVLHVGRDDSAGFFFYVMELADNAAGSSSPQAAAKPVAEPPNGSLATPAGSTFPLAYRPRTLALDLRNRGRLPVAEVLRLGIQLADALGHLHRHGLVHRDVKPSNVIFIQNQAKLADIGLVAGMDETRSFVGTEGFVPPEGHGTERADLFSLGRLLYEAVAGKDRCEFPELPSDLDQWPAAEREILLELNEVLVRACAPDPADRHPNTAALAADLNLILGGRSVRQAYGFERRLRRARRASGLTLGILAAAAAFVAFQDHARHSAEVRASEEAVLRHRAEAAEHDARRQLYVALQEQARANRLSRELGQRFATLNAVRRAAAISNAAELRREAFAALALPDLRTIRELPHLPGEIAHAMDPGFERIAISRGAGPVEIVAASDRRPLTVLPGSGNLEAHLLTWSPDGRYLAFKRDRDIRGDHSDLEIWDVSRHERVVSASQVVTANALSFHPHRPLLLAGAADGRVTLWDLESGRNVRAFHLDGIASHLQHSPDGTRFTATCRARGASHVAIHDSNDGSLLASHPFTNWLTRAEWHPGGRSIVVLDYSGNVRILDPLTGELQHLGQHKAAAVSVAFEPDANFMITGGWERELMCWDLRTMQRAFTIGISGYVTRFHANRSECLIHATDRLLHCQFQAPDTHRLLQESLGPWLAYAAISHDDRWLAACGDQSVAVWDLDNPGPAALIPSFRDNIPVFAPHGGDLYTAWEDTMGRWHLAGSGNSGPPALNRLPVLVPPGLRSLAFVGGEMLCVCSDGVRFMPPGNTNSNLVRHVSIPGGWGCASPDGRWLVIRQMSSPIVRVLSLPTLEPVATLTHRTAAWDHVFTPAADELAVITLGGLVFYDTSTWQVTHTLDVRCERQSRIVFAPDGATFWFASDARTAALRDTRTMAVLLPLPAGYLPLAVTSDGSRVAMSVDMQRIQLWDIPAVRHQFRVLGVDWQDPSVRETSVMPRPAAL